MAKSDTVHKCEVMDFFAYESYAQEKKRWKNRSPILLGKKVILTQIPLNMHDLIMLKNNHKGLQM